MKATGLYYEDFVVGKVYETAARQVTMREFELFGEVEGSKSPMHLDPEYAKKHTIFGGLSAHGLLVVSMASGLMGQMGLFEGTSVAFLGINWQFKKGTMVGDTIRVRWWVKEKRTTSKPGRALLVRQVEVLNQNDEVLCGGEWTALWQMRPSEVTGA